MTTEKDVKIHVKGLKKSFGHVHVLKGIDAEIKAGEVICVIGPSGSGKSTFLRCLNRLEEATAGEILVDGQSITEKSSDIDKIRQHIGMVFQQFNLFPHYTVKENIMLAPVELKLKSKEEAEKKALELLKRVGLAEKADAKPKQLSGGQQQRVAIARALVNNPKIILADEPTGALDSRSGIQVMNLFQQLNEEGVTIIMITHDANIANHAKKVLHIFDGEIVEDKARKEKEKQQSEVQSEAAESVSSELEKDFGVNAWEGEI